ncbi:putative leucine-rich repeat receptor serine/threonine-protein kinase [Trifolium repens]|nr:putative leucine-rich repeat receptor serine/threonine-protein kinase [Trifolium repens]
MSLPLLFHLFVLTFCFISSFAGGATLLEEEVQVMKDIGRTLGKKDWDFSIDPCSGENNWTSSVKVKGFESAVTCNCSFANATICHIVSIVLKSQNLSGTLPREFVKLPYLQQIDLTRNYLNGTIPSQWGSMINLVNISLLGNRLTGQIPKELGKITTLKSLVLEFNQLSGKLPSELGNLHQLERLLLTSNNLTGNLPATFAKLTKLKQIRLGDNQFSGTLPDFIQSWTGLQRLVMQASGLSGPVPSGISYLKNLTDLRISDLKGPDSPFPQLIKLTILETLVLRSCNLIGTVPAYLGNITTLRSLDLSFNKLSGQIPNTLGVLQDINILYLTGNLFTGPLPNWIARPDYTDLSYNNLSIENPEQLTCQQGTVNLFSSSSKGSNLGMVSCLGNNGCPKHSYSLHINCGGKLITSNKSLTYDDDSYEVGPASFHRSGSNWALSNTVNLHFAEIMFTDDQTYSSLGRRIFDIYIQGRLVLKDFNIAKEAGGVGKAIIKKFTAIVTNNTLEIRLHWAGKGTTAIPFGSVHGPLISAISVDPDFTPPVEKGSSIPVRNIVAIVVSAALVILFVFGIALWRICRRQIGPLERELKSLDLQTGLFTLRQIKEATNNFDISNKIGEGGFGPVYKGCLPNGTLIAVKQLSSKSKQGNHQLLLIYEYLENNSLARALFGPEEHRIRLDWSTRKTICVGIARGLAYLHEESRLKVVHRDIKATNVLLDTNLDPKISDFGLAKLDEEDNTHISTRIAGTYGYMAPEYAMHGYLTDKADVYSFGIVALEIVSGKSNTLYQSKEEAFYLLDWAHMLKERGDLMELVDSRLGSDFNKKEVLVVINVALLCTNVTSNLRPSMSSVVSMLEGSTVVPESVPVSSEVMDEKKMEVMRQYYCQMEENNTSKSQTQSRRLLNDAPWTASSSSADLYPIYLDSSYLEDRN